VCVFRRDLKYSRDDAFLISAGNILLFPHNRMTIYSILVDKGDKINKLIYQMITDNANNHNNDQILIDAKILTT